MSHFRLWKEFICPIPFVLDREHKGAQEHSIVNGLGSLFLALFESKGERKGILQKGFPPPLPSIAYCLSAVYSSSIELNELKAQRIGEKEIRERHRGKKKRYSLKKRQSPFLTG